MKKLFRIVLTIQFALMLTHCATSPDDLYRTYAVCREQTLHPKVSETGIVQVNKSGEPIMVYRTGACPTELQAYEQASILREKRRRDREAYDALMGSCGNGTLMCSGRGGATKCISRAGVIDKFCRCQCMSAWEVRRMMGTRVYRHAIPCVGPRPVTE